MNEPMILDFLWLSFFRLARGSPKLLLNASLIAPRKPLMLTNSPF
jgi:hypothetical protein